MLGLLWFLQRRLGRRAAQRRDAEAITVVGRQGLGGKAQMVVVQTDDARYVLGVTEHGVNLLDRIDSDRRTARAESVFRAEDRRDDRGAGSFDEIIARASQTGETSATSETTDAHADAVAASAPQLRRHLHRRPDPLRGSILSPVTWRQTAEFIRRAR